MKADAISVDSDFNFFNYVSQKQMEKSIECILIDEVQFLSRDQIRQICKVSDELNIPAMCYGIPLIFRAIFF